MTLDELVQKVPERFRPVAARYGPALLKMSADELWAWIDLLIRGDATAAYRSVLSRMEGADLLAEWDRVGQQWAEANAENAARLEMQRAAVLATMRVLLTVALASVGL